MAAVAYIDRVDTLDMQERLGMARNLTRKARVIFTSAIPTSYKALWEALTTAGIPLPFSRIRNDTPSPIMAPLVLVDRSASIAEGEKTVVDVTLRYEHILDGPYQVLFDKQNRNRVAPARVLYGKKQTSISQKAANAYRPYGIGPLTQILTAFTFPLKDPNIANYRLFPQWPHTVVQGGEVELPYPQATYTVEGIVYTNNIQELEKSLVPTINQREWLGRPATTWLCSRFATEVIDPYSTPMVYKASIEFQYDIDTWNRFVVFKDERTGLPPYNVMAQRGTENDPTLAAQGINVESYTRMQGLANVTVPGVVTQGKPWPVKPASYWQVPALRRVDYNRFFNAVFEVRSA